MDLVHNSHTGAWVGKRDRPRARAADGREKHGDAVETAPTADFVFPPEVGTGALGEDRVADGDEQLHQKPLDTGKSGDDVVSPP